MNAIKKISGLSPAGVLSLTIAALSLILYAAFPVNCAESEQHNNNLLCLGEQKKVEDSTALFNNAKNILPLKNLEKRKIACISIDSEHSTPFTGMLRKYSQVTSFSVTGGSFKISDMKELNRKLKTFNTVIIQATGKALDTPRVFKFINNLRKTKQLIICAAGESGILKNTDKLSYPVIITPMDSEISAVYCAQAVFGGVSISSNGKCLSPVRLKYTVPEDAGINCDDLKPVDEIMDEAISGKATPGAVIIVVKDGKVIFEKSYGYHTYDGKQAVSTTDIYDLASITKSAATTIAVMRLYEQKKLILERAVSSYIPETRRTNKKNITVKELMTHEAGLSPSLDFSRYITKDDYRTKYSAAYSVRVTDKYFLRKNYYKKNMWPRILKSPVETRGRYVYSDIGMFFVKELVERRTGQSFYKYLNNNFYIPLGMQTSGFNPRERFSRERLVPTEVDDYFRNTTLTGYVHDQAAAMTGGVAGHAGLFSDGNDLAILFQMLLNRGSYGGATYFRGETVDSFTAKCSDLNRRTLGFDGWDPESRYGFPSSMASRKIFGHTGFTGTCVWADPENNLIFIFLSNRTYPKTPNKLASMNIRSRILNVLYEAISKSTTAETAR